MEKEADLFRNNTTGAGEMRFPKPIITKEHGSWAVLLIPITVAAATVGAFTANAALLVVSAVGVFMSYVPLNALLRNFIDSSLDREHVIAHSLWGMIYLAVGVAAALPLVHQGFWMIFPLGSIAVLLFFINFLLIRSLQKNVLTDLVGVAGLALGAPAMYYVLTLSLDHQAWILYVMNILFFGSSVVYVHLKIRVTRGKKSDWTLLEKLAAGRLNLAYHAFVIAIVLALSLYRLTPATAVLAFVPMTIHAMYGTYRLSSRVSFSRLGFALLAHSIGFALLWTIIVLL
jgi:hypothetical protein